MDAPLREGEDFNLYDIIKSGESPNPESELLNDSLKIEIGIVLKTLTDREADVIKLYYGIGNIQAMTLDEIGEGLGLTRERVRQIKEKALMRLKKTGRSNSLAKYLG
jgi:RNA polymerase primary sigma factor